MPFVFIADCLLAIFVATAPLRAVLEMRWRRPPAPGQTEPHRRTRCAAHDEHHTLPLKAVELFHIGKFTVTNSMLMTWIVAALIIFFAQFATRNIKEVPTGAQNFWEWLVESLYNFLGGIIGPELVKKTFWFFATFFIFILSLNWFGLIPGVGTIGWGHTSPTAGNFIVDEPLLRGANADLNLTFAMACVFFVCWIVWAIQANGVGGVLMHIFGPKGTRRAF